MQKIIINATPHSGQKEVHTSPVRFKVLAAGRRRQGWGKTRLGVNECFDVASRGGRAWWVAPTYKMSEVGWRPIRQMAVQVNGDVNLSDRRVILPNGGEISVRSADNPDSLRGESLNLVIMDEAAFVKEAAWTEALRPALSDRKGKAIFISTPKGRNWFWHIWQRGQEGGEWQSWQLPTETNPYIDPAEIEAARLSLPERIFQQEYLAQFIEDGAGVFRRIMAAATSTPLEQRRGGAYVFGVDWGKFEDFTAISVIDIVSKKQVALDRFNQIDYHVQTQRLKAMADKFQPVSIIAEANSIGEPLIENLRRMGLPVRPFTTTNASKSNIIEALALAFERGEISILSDPVQIAELQAYELERLPGGMVRYNAPAGLHDDTVMALALAWHGASKPKTTVRNYAS